MTILTHKQSCLNENKLFISRSLFLDQGNIKPDQLYKIITFYNGKADYLAVDLYSNIRSWYKPKKIINNYGNIVQVSKLKNGIYKTSYCYLAKKYQVSKETIRAKLVKLEKLGLLNRAFSTENRFYNRRENNILNILVWKNTPHFISDIGLAKTQELVELCHDKTIIKDLAPSPEPSGDIYSNTNNLSLKNVKNRSNESNFFKNELDNSKDIDISNKINPPETKSISTNKVAEHLETLDNIKTYAKNLTRKSLAKFHPLVDEDIKLLQNLSGRDFNLNYVNKLILKLAKDKPNHGFYTRELFFKYMTSVLKEEKRLESIANNIDFNFRIKGDLAHKIKYLNDLEFNRDTSSDSHLRKKIAAVFEMEIAYEILVNCSFSILDKLQDIQNEHKYEIKMKKQLNLTENQINILLRQVQAIYGKKVRKLDFIYQNIFQKVVAPKIELFLGEKGSLWNRISTKLLKYYGENIHKSWFSKLDVKEDEKQRTIILKAPTNFIKQWLIDNYRHVIEDFCIEEGYILDNINA